MDALLLRHPRRARAVRCARRGGASVGDRPARGMAPAIRDQRSLRGKRPGQGSRRLSRGARDLEGCHDRRRGIRMTVAVPSAARADRVVELLRERELDSLLVSNLVNVRYLTGFTGTNGACVITPDERLFLTDFRYVSQAEEQVHDFERLPAGRELATDLAKHLSGRAGFDDEPLTVRTHGRLTEKVGEGVELVAAGGLVESLREVKDENELALMRSAAALATQALERTIEGGLAGRMEAEVARELEQAMRRLGAEDPSFSATVAAGPHGALPHAEPRDAQIPTGTLVVIDWGARVDGYCS